MYDKTIAADHRIYSITVNSATPARVVDLLSVDDKAEYVNITRTNGLESIKMITGRPHNKYIRTPVDGYLICHTASFLVHTSVSGVGDIVLQSVYYPIPVYHWPEKTWVSIDQGSETLYVKIFFS